MALEFMIVGLAVSERRACQLIQLARSTHRYLSQARDDTALRIRLKDLAASRVRYGYRRLHVLLLREGGRSITRKSTGCTAR
jgi:putative transposase